MLEGGGKVVLSAGNRVTGPGHFGHFVEEEGVEKMSCHYEADMDLSGRSVLAINALQWRDDWPFVGDPFKDTSGPSLNILIKLMSMVSIVMAGLTVAFS